MRRAYIKQRFESTLKWKLEGAFGIMEKILYMWDDNEESREEKRNGQENSGFVPGGTWI